MSTYLPDTYTRFRNGHPEVASALDAVGSAVDGAGPLDARTMRLVKLALAIGAGAEGAVRSNVRKATTEGAGEAEIRQVALAAITTVGFPACVAGLSWIDDVLGS
jgi:4-carboxymuconolactone decarboxylase